MNIISGSFRKQINGDESGASAVEFAVVLPVLVVLVFGILYFGLIFNNYLVLTHAAREGVRQASLQRSEGAGNGLNVENAIRATADTLDADAIDITIDPYDDRPSGESVTVTLRYPVQVGVPVISNIFDAAAPALWNPATDTLTLETTAKMRVE
ncbi:MAG: TadE/TadG family type IV pilus assembly protein [Candidatus Aquicultorales bacterium]